MSLWSDFKLTYDKGKFLTQSNGFRYSFKLVNMKMPKRKKRKYKGKKSIVYNLPIFLKNIEVSVKEVAEKLKKDNLTKFTQIVSMPCKTGIFYTFQLSESAFNQLGLFIKLNNITEKDTITYERFGEFFGTRYKFEVKKKTKV